MKDTGKTGTDKSRLPASGAVAGWLPFLLVAGLLLGIGAVLVSNIRGKEHAAVKVVEDARQAKDDLRAAHDAMVEQEAKLREQSREANIAAGLDPDYPVWKFPLYPGLEILETRRDEAQSTLGEKMDQWYIKGQVDAELKDIEQFYKDKLMAADMRQTQYISIPSGYAFNYANEWYDSHFTMEKKAEDPMPVVEMTIYRVQDAAVDFNAAPPG